MLRALPKHFPDTTNKIDETGRKRWSMPSGALRDLMTLSADELAGLKGVDLENSASAI